MAADHSLPVNKALFVRRQAKPGKAAELVAFLRDGLFAVMEEQDTTTWYVVRFGHGDFAIFDTFPDNTGRLAGTPSIEHAQVLAFKLPDASGQVEN